MKFIDYYASLKTRELKRAVRNRVVFECKIQLPTFYFWKRTNRFPALAQEKIAKILNKPQSELFPINENDNPFKLENYEY